MINFLSSNLSINHKIAFGQTKTVKQGFDKSLNNDIFQKSDSLNAKVLCNGGRLQSLVFNKPVVITQALMEMINSKNDFVNRQLELRFHTKDNLIEMLDAIQKNEMVKNVKVKSLLGFGAYSLAFETKKGEVLKISEINQFYDNRKIDWFDVPIRDSGCLSKNKFYYYFEEKLEQTNLEKEDLKQFILEIIDSGYVISDFLRGESRDAFGRPIEQFKFEQFGRDKKGKLYLVDAGCARKLPQNDNFLEKFFRWFKDNL